MSGWLAGLDAFVVGLAYLVALLTTRFVVRPLLVNVLGQAPVVGGWLSSNVDAGILAFERAITPAAEASMGTLVSALDWLTTQARGVLSGLGDLADATYGGLWNLATVTLPQAVQQSLAYTEGLIVDARDYTWRLVQGAEQLIATSFGQAEADAVALVSATEGALRSEITTVESVALLEIRRAEKIAGALFSQAEHDAELLVAASEVKLADLVSRAREDLSGAVAAVEHDLQTLAKAERVALEDSVSILGGDLQAAEARANQALAGLEEQTQKSIEGILAGLPWQALVALVGIGEAELQAGVRTQIGLGLKEIHKAIGDAEAIRAKYGPQVRAVLDQLKVP